jgi:RecT family
MDISKIEDRINRTELGSIEMPDDVGGVAYRNLSEMLEFGKMMATTTMGVPKHLRGEVGGCVRIVMQALEWRMSPFAVADKSYFVNDRIAYESQLIHAVVESRAPLQKRLRFEFEGEGPTRLCIVNGWFKGESDPVIYRSPMFKDIPTKNSPLWKSDPDQQLCYYSVRAWSRRYCPDVLMGIYSKDELEDSGEFVGSEKAKDITPKPSLAERLKGNKANGFNAAHVASETAKTVEQAKPIQQKPVETIDQETGEVAEFGVPDAYEAGQKARADGLSLDDMPAHIKQFPNLAEAYADGYNAEVEA